MAVEEEKAGEAMAPIQESRRTFRDARARQHVVKMSRQFFQHDLKQPEVVEGMVVFGSN